MTKRKLFLPILIFVLYELVAVLGSLFWLADPNLLAAFLLTACGLTVLLAYAMVARLTDATKGSPPASAPETTAPAPSTASTGPSPVTALIQEANEQLAKSPTLASQRVKSTIADFPLYFVFGAGGSGKTSLFLASRIEPELLAGQVHRESVIVPTRLANIWFADNAVVVEGAGDFFSGEGSRWKDFLASFHRPGGKSRFARIFGANAETKLSGVLLCCDASAFVGVPDSARLAAIGRLAQQRLRMIGEVFGRDFLVYVIFTKSDSIPYFGEYFGRLAESEDAQVLGCTYPETAPGQSPTIETITAGLNKLYLSLADQRLEYLEREKNSAKRPGIYEFPREFKRLRGPLGQFLVDMFRANPLQPNPRLLGVYFTGTRKVVGQAADLDRSAIHKVGDVTRILCADDLQRLRAQGPDSPDREPEITRWSFVPDLWQQILQRRQTAGANLYINRQQQSYRKVAYISAIAVSAVASLLFVISFARNYYLVNDVKVAARKCEAVPERSDPSLLSLRHINAFRDELDALGKPSLFGHLGFNQRETLSDPAWGAYFTRFRQYFLDAIVRQLESELSQLPSERNPAYPYDPVFAQMKTYRTITTSLSEVSCAADSALVDRLMDNWRQNRPADSGAEEIARENFRFYADGLKLHKNPGELRIQSKDDQVVQRGRTYLGAFKGAEPQYHEIIERVNREMPSPTRLADLKLNANYRSVMHVGEEVQTAFTRPDGWNRVQELIESSAAGSAGETCVLGNGGSHLAILPPAVLRAQLRELYVEDYIRRWSEFLASASVLPYNKSCGDTVKKLSMLADNNSPILAVLFLVADNTSFPKHAGSGMQKAAQSAGNVVKGFHLFGRKPTAAAGQVRKSLDDWSADGPNEDKITSRFQPAQQVFEESPPNRERWNDLRNTNYLDSLRYLKHAFDSLNQNGKCDGTNQEANSRAGNELGKANKAVDDLARYFHINDVSGKVTALLESPLRGLPISNPSDAKKQTIDNAKQRLCESLKSLSGKYPFDPKAEDGADLPQVKKVFDLGQGPLIEMRHALGDLVVESGGIWSQRDDPAVKLSRNFLNFFNSMYAISKALFSQQGGPADMRYTLWVRPNSSGKQVTGPIDGQQISMSEREYSWPGPNPGVDLRVDQGALCKYSGTWGIFKLLSNAVRTTESPNQFRLIYLQAGKGSEPQLIVPDGSAIVLEVPKFPNGVQNAFYKGFFGVSCPKQIFE